MLESELQLDVVLQSIAAPEFCHEEYSTADSTK
jgi:hypothetical protein